MSHSQKQYGTIQNNDLEIVNHLILKGKVNINEKDAALFWSRLTPLMVAVLKKQTNIVECLLINGADPFIPNEEGHTLFGFIYETVFDHITQLIKRLGYVTTSPIAGICHGLMGVIRHYLSRGREGVNELTLLYAFLYSKTSDQLKKDIDDAEKISKEVAKELSEKREKAKENGQYEKRKKKLREDYNNKLLLKSQTELREINEENQISEEELYTIIDSVLKIEFDDTSYDERKEIINKIINHTFKNINVPISETKNLFSNHQLFFHIEKIILDALYRFLMQKDFKNKVRERLEMKGLPACVLDLHPFIQNIALYQGLPMPDYENLFEKNVDKIRKKMRNGILFRSPIYAQSISAVFSLASTKEEEENGLVVFHERGSFGVFDEYHLLKLFSYWQTKLRNQNIKSFCIQIKVLGHTYSIHYFPSLSSSEDDEWIFQDNTIVEKVFFNDVSQLVSKITKASGQSLPIILSSLVLTNKKDNLKLNEIIDVNSSDQEWDFIHEWTDKKLENKSRNVILTNHATETTNQTLINKLSNKNLALPPITKMRNNHLIQGLFFLLGASTLVLSGILFFPILPVVSAPVWGLAMMTFMYGIKKIKDHIHAKNKVVENSENFVKLHEEVEQNNAIRFPSTQRIKNKLSQKTQSGDDLRYQAHLDQAATVSITNDSAEEGRKIPCQSKELFTLDHTQYCRIKRIWNDVWAEKQQFTADQEMVDGIKKPGFFDLAPKAFGYHEHYAAINDIFNQIDKQCDPHFKEAIKNIDEQLQKLINSKLINTLLPNKIYQTLLSLSQQLNHYVIKFHAGNSGLNIA